MKCPRESGQGPEMLLAYSSGELDTEMAADFEEHFRTCPACGEEAAAQQAVWSALDAWEAPRDHGRFRPAPVCPHPE